MGQNYQHTLDFKMTAVTPVSVFCQDQFRRKWVLNNMPVLGSYPNPTIIKCPHGVCKERPDLENAPIETYHFVKPDSDSLNTFYNSWHRYFKQQGFDFVKVDNQLVVEKMAEDYFPYEPGERHKCCKPFTILFISGKWCILILTCFNRTIQMEYTMQLPGPLIAGQFI